MDSSGAIGNITAAQGAVMSAADGTGDLARAIPMLKKAMASDRDLVSRLLPIQPADPGRLDIRA